MFIIRQPNGDTPTTITIKTTVSDGRFEQSLGTKVLPAFWDKATERAILTNLDKTTLDEHKSINNQLQKIEGFIEGYKRDSRYTGKPLTKAILGKKVGEIIGKIREDNTLYPAAEAIIKEMEDGKLLTAKGKRYTESSIRKYNQSLEIFRSFAPGLTFQGVTMDFYREYCEHGVKKNWSMNYTGTHIKNLKRIMDESLERGLHDNMEFKKKSFRRLREETDAVALDMDELQIMYEFACADEYEDRGRDWFVLDCFTGLRISDIQMLEDRNKDMITIINQKTGAKVVIPKHPYVKEIMKKWGGLPPKMSNDDISKHAKNVARIAGMNETIAKKITKGGRIVAEYLPKWKMISPHTARRSFITNLLEACVPDNLVMQLTGIVQHTTLVRYKKTKAEKAAEIMKDHDFFRGQKRTESK